MVSGGDVWQWFVVVVVAVEEKDEREEEGKMSRGSSRGGRMYCWGKDIREEGSRGFRVG